MLVHVIYQRCKGRRHFPGKLVVFENEPEEMSPSFVRAGRFERFARVQDAQVMDVLKVARLEVECEGHVIGDICDDLESFELAGG